jgi:hypothetical protein
MQVSSILAPEFYNFGIPVRVKFVQLFSNGKECIRSSPVKDEIPPVR